MPKNIEIHKDENKQNWVCRVLKDQIIIVKCKVDVADQDILDTVEKGKID